VPNLTPIGPAVWPPILNRTTQHNTTQHRTEELLEKYNIDYIRNAPQITVVVYVHVCVRACGEGEGLCVSRIIYSCLIFLCVSYLKLLQSTPKIPVSKGNSHHDTEAQRYVGQTNTYIMCPGTVNDAVYTVFVYTSFYCIHMGVPYTAGSRNVICRSVF
jgi:hypothetical protein